jgi:hypothetical protein
MGAGGSLVERPRLHDDLRQRSQGEGSHGHHEDGSGHRRGGPQPRIASLRVRCIGPGRPESLDDRAERGAQPLHHRIQVAKQGLDCLGIPDQHPGQECRAGRGEPGADPLQAVSGRLDQVRGGAQGATQDFLVVMFALMHHA